VNWIYKVTADAVEQEIVAGGILLNSNDKRFIIDSADLVIKKARQNDSGVYICIENQGFGDRHAMELTVIGRPICHLPRDAMHPRAMALCLSVCLSVCPSVRHKSELY